MRVPSQGHHGGLWPAGRQVVTVAVVLLLAVQFSAVGVVGTEQLSAATETEAYVVDDGQLGSADESAVVDAAITSFAPNAGTYTAGDTYTAEVRVENTGDTRHTFFVGFDVRGPEDNYYNNDGTTGKTVTLDPGETTWVTVSWTVQEDIPTGSYDTVVAVWKESDRDNLQTRLDNVVEEDVFTVTEPGTVEGYVTDEDGDPIEGAKVYLDSIRDTRTDEGGYYSFSEVGAGDHEVYVTAGACYETPTKSVSVSGGETARSDFSLESKSYTVTLQTDPVDASTEGSGTYDCGEDVTISAPETEGSYEFVAWETPDGDLVSEQATFTMTYLTSDKELVARYRQAGKPDLTIVDVRIEPSDPTAGDTVTFYVEIRNRGEARATNVETELVVDNDILRSDGVDLEPGESTTLQLPTWSATAGSFEVSAEIDYDDEIAEEDESNNDYSTTVSVAEPKPDLTVVDVEWRPAPPTAGEDVQFRLIIRNTGKATAETIETRVLVDGNAVTVPPTTTLDPGETHTTPWTGSYEFTGGTHDVTGVVDPDDHISESDESDNSVSKSVSVDQKVGTITGQVTGSDGTPVEGALVTLDDREQQTRTDSDGQYRFENVPAGEHTVSVAASEYESAETTVMVEAGTTVSADIVLQPTPPAVAASIETVSLSSGSYEAGETVTTTATVENTGRDTHTFYVGYGFLGPDDETYDGNGTTHVAVELAPGESKTVELSWTVPERAPPGKYSAVVAVWESEDDGKLSGRLAERRPGSVRVEAAAATSVTGIDATGVEGPLQAGSEAVVSVTIRNDGSKMPIRTIFQFDTDGDGDPEAVDVNGDGDPDYADYDGDGETEPGTVRGDVENTVVSAGGTQSFGLRYTPDQAGDWHVRAVMQAHPNDEWVDAGTTDWEEFNVVSNELKAGTLWVVRGSPTATVSQRNGLIPAGGPRTWVIGDDVRIYFEIEAARDFEGSATAYVRFCDIDGKGPIDGDWGLLGEVETTCTGRSSGVTLRQTTVKLKNLDLEAGERIRVEKTITIDNAFQQGNLFEDRPMKPSLVFTDTVAVGVSASDRPPRMLWEVSPTPNVTSGLGQVARVAIAFARVKSSKKAAKADMIVQNGQSATKIYRAIRAIRDGETESAVELIDTAIQASGIESAERAERISRAVVEAVDLSMEGKQTEATVVLLNLLKQESVAELKKTTEIVSPYAEVNDVAASIVSGAIRLSQWDPAEVDYSKPPKRTLTTSEMGFNVYAGTIEDQDGNQVSGATVTVYDAPPDDPRADKLGQSRTESDGTFRVSGLPTEEQTIWITVTSGGDPLTEQAIVRWYDPEAPTLRFANKIRLLNRPSEGLAEPKVSTSVSSDESTTERVVTTVEYSVIENPVETTEWGNSGGVFLRAVNGTFESVEKGEFDTVKMYRVSGDSIKKEVDDIEKADVVELYVQRNLSPGETISTGDIVVEPAADVSSAGLMYRSWGYTDNPDSDSESTDYYIARDPAGPSYNRHVVNDGYTFLNYPVDRFKKTVSATTPDTPEFQNRAVYVWGYADDLATNPAARERFIERAERRNLNTVFLSWGALSNASPQERATLLRALNESGIQVHAAIGPAGPDAIQATRDTIPAVLSYNADRPAAEQFDGIHLGAEPDGAELKPFLGEYQALLSEVETGISADGETVRSQDLAVSAAVGWWWGQSDETPKATDELVESSALDYVVVMAYYDDPAEVRRRTTKITDETDTPYVVAVETQEFPKEGTTERVTFYEEGPQAVTTTLERIASDPPTAGYLGGALHYYQSAVAKWDSLVGGTTPDSVVRGETATVDVKTVFDDNFPRSSHRSELVTEFRGPERTYTVRKSVTPPGGEVTASSIGWNVPADAATGEYTVVVKLRDPTYENKDREAYANRSEPVLLDSKNLGTISVAESSNRTGENSSRGDPPAPAVAASIETVSLPNGNYEAGETVTTTVTVENTGRETHTFYVGYSFLGPDDETYDGNGSTHVAVKLAPGESRTVELSWAVPKSAPPGEYSAVVAVWRSEDDGTLSGRLAEQRPGSVRVESTAVTSPTPTNTTETPVNSTVVDSFSDGEYADRWSVPDRDDEAILEAAGVLRHISPEKTNARGDMVTKRTFRAEGTVTISVRQRQLVTDYWGSGFGILLGESRITLREHKWEEHDRLAVFTSEEVYRVGNATDAYRWMTYNLTIDFDTMTLVSVSRGDQRWELGIDLPETESETFRIIIGGDRNHDTLYDFVRIVRNSTVAPEEESPTTSPSRIVEGESVAPRLTPG